MTRTTRTARVTTAALGLLLLAGCSSGDDAETYPVSASVLGVSDEEWPLTVDEAQVECLGNKQLGLDVDGRVYALNGLAKQTGQYADLTDVWRDDPNVEGLKLSMDDLTFWALDQCGY